MQNEYLQRLRRILVAEGIPYGFTLTIWATGTLGVERYGPLSTTAVFLFIMAAIAGYGVFALLLEVFTKVQDQGKEHRSGISYLDFLSVPIAVGVVIAAYHFISAPLLGLTTASFLAVIAYNLVLAAKRTIVEDD